MIVAYIDAYRDEFGVEPICAVLAEAGATIAPSTYYARKSRPLSARAISDAIWMPILMTLWVANRKVYGPTSCGGQPGVPVMRSAGTGSPV